MKLIPASRTVRITRPSNWSAQQLSSNRRRACSPPCTSINMNSAFASGSPYPYRRPNTPNLNGGDWFRPVVVLEVTATRVVFDDRGVERATTFADHVFRGTKAPTDCPVEGGLVSHAAVVGGPAVPVAVVDYDCDSDDNNVSIPRGNGRDTAAYLTIHSGSDRTDTNLVEWLWSIEPDTGTATLDLMVGDVLPGDLLVGDSGGLSSVLEYPERSSAMPGTWRAETEHGVVYLDDEFSVKVLRRHP